MCLKPSLVTRIAVGKLIGLTFGILGFIFLSACIPSTSWLLRCGILLWYTMVGATIGVFGVITYHPILEIPLPWWFRSSFIGAWMNFILSLFIYKDLQSMMFAISIFMFGKSGVVISPFWFVLEGALVGLFIGFLSTRYGGEGKQTVEQ